MKVKGVAVKSTVNFVKQKFSNDYNKWIDSLPSETASILTSNISDSEWYPFNSAAIIPTNSIIKMFYSNDINGAKEIGRFSAKQGLSGIYKYFIKLGSPKFIINKASKVFETYFKDSQIEVVLSTKESVLLKITIFDELDKNTEARISGWIEKALEISGCNNLESNYIFSLTEGDDSSELFVTWN